MADTAKTADTEEIVMWLVGAAAALACAPLAVARFAPAAADFLVRWHVLTRFGVLLPVAGGAGLDLARLAAAAAILVALVLIAGSSLSRARRRREARR